MDSAVSLLVKCSFCGHKNEVRSSGEHRNGRRGPLASNNNTRAALRSLHAGIGNIHLNNLLSTMNIPTINHRLFKKREREIRNAVENIARESCKLNFNLEKVMAEQSSRPSADGLVGIAVSYDMGWQKRGRGYNASTGHEAAMGLVTGKVVSYSARCKMCRVCSHNKLTGREKSMTVVKITMVHQSRWNEMLHVNCGVKLLKAGSNFPSMLGMMIQQH